MRKGPWAPTPLMIIVDPPVLVTVTVRDACSPTRTSPKAIDVGLIVASGGPTPVPASATDRGLPGASSVRRAEPDAAPSSGGGRGTKRWNGPPRATGLP